MPDEFLARISRLGTQTDSIAEKVLQAGGEVALAKVRSNLKSVVGSGTKSKSRSTGELERSLGLSQVMVDKNGNHDIKVGFSEPRTDGGSNGKIANILEYGTSSQSAKPFLKPAKSAVKKQCVDAMKSAFEKEVEGL
nr:MAG TPA: type I neck protein [Caudoviricetes sp.]